MPIRRRFAVVIGPLLAAVLVTIAVLPFTSNPPAAAAPTITRYSIPSAHDASMLAPDGTGKVWFALPGTLTYGYVSGGTVTELTNSLSPATSNDGGNVARKVGSMSEKPRPSPAKPSAMRRSAITILLQKNQRPEYH